MLGKTKRTMRGVGREFGKALKKAMPAEAVGWVKELRGNVPDQAVRMNYFDKTIGKKMKARRKNGKIEASPLHIRIKRHYRLTGELLFPKEIRQAPLAIAIERSFDAVANERKYSAAGKKLRKIAINSAIQRLYKKGRFSFEGEPKARFGKDGLKSLRHALGPDSTLFLKKFKRHFKEEVGWAKHYLLVTIDPAEVLNAWERKNGLAGDRMKKVVGKKP